MVINGYNAPRNLIKNIYLKAKTLLDKIVVFLAKRAWARKFLNTLYQALPLNLKGSFHHYFALIFRDQDPQCVAPGLWHINFIDNQIKIPLRENQFWLDWAVALSVVGHEVEIKEAYASLIKSPKPPEIFIDIGANYGTHSLLFLVQGIETISFEPNMLCNAFFKEICSFNNVEPWIEEIALGNCNGYTQLGFTAENTWLGSTDPVVIQNWKSNSHLITREVKQSTLDECLSELSGRRLLLKIDTEGNEYKILQGAFHTLRNNYCWIVFESWLDNKRIDLFELLDSCNYRIYKLPWSYGTSSSYLDASHFCDSQEADFIAISCDEIC